eukprot:scaffold147387_cov48-Prasinocladus_malaysianus.AAC.1
MRADETSFIKGSMIDQQEPLWREFKSSMIDMVLATDMSNHFETITKVMKKRPSAWRSHPSWTETNQVIAIL